MTSTAVTMTTTASQPTIGIHQPREPPTFHGSSFEDPETWLETYNRVAALNHWDNEEKLRHVYFYLEDTARTWLENRESMLRTCDVFCGALLQTFVSVARKERAAALLETRVQQPNENIAIFTEEITRLFRHADPDMPEEKEVRFLLRGVKQELFAGLRRNPPNTVQAFVSEATTI